MTLESGLDIPTERIADVCQRYGIQEMAIFGSAARGEMRADSDVDVMVEFLPDARYGFGRPVDLGTKKYMKAHVRKHILKEALVIYGG